MTIAVRNQRFLVSSVVATLVALTSTRPLPAQTQVDYRRAEQMLSWHASPLVTGDSVSPNWLPNQNRFWYRNKTASGAAFVLIDPVRNTRRLVFDNARLAAAMSLANDTSYDPVKLPFRTFDFVENERAIEFKASKKLFRCALATYSCTVGDTLPDDRPFVVSPDSMWEAFSYEYNLYIRPREGGDSVQLTTDGEMYWSYGLTAPRPRHLLKDDSPPRTPRLRWSPDSKQIAVPRIDERNVEHMHYISYTGQRTRHFSQPYALPGDSVIPLPAVHVVNIDTKSNVKIELPATAVRISLAGTPRDSVWSSESGKLNFVWYTRGSKSLYLIEADAATGATRVLAKDSAATFVELSPRDPPSWYVSDNGNDVIWWSERDGWAHLYLFDGNGNLKNQITRGAWTVGAVQHVDEGARQIYFTARGREPDRLLYYAHLYRVKFDGSELTLLTPEDAHHRVEFSPNGRHFVDTYSSIETPPVTALRSARDGRVIRRLEEADVSRLEAIGWSPGDVFTVKARDGITDLYGVMYKPSNFDPAKQYPVLDYIYPGPQVGSVRRWWWTTGGEQRATAELGFIVVAVDHLGTPFRSKAFHDNYYGNFGDNGIPDHITALKQLAVRHPYIDLDRVGIWGHSGGGFASTDAILRYPDFYKVAVSGAGNHDNRSYNIYWAEKYQGLLKRDTLRNSDNFEASANQSLVSNLRGKLLLMHGDMDDNVHMAMTIQVVNQLIKANKDFDLIIAPDRAHSLNEPYFIRRRWDYFVRHLLGAEPPQGYEIVKPENGQ